MATITTVPCIVCHESSVLEITDEEKAALESGAHRQDALSNRDADFRELVISGTHPACWEKMFGGDEDDEFDLDDDEID